MGLTLPPLSYALDALEPHLSRHTLAAHYGRRHAGYVEEARALVQRTPLETATLEKIVLASTRQLHARTEVRLERDSAVRTPS